MAKKTLLQLVQNILSSMDSDEVNSINDTIEALQVAAIVGTTYDDMIDNSNWPHLHRLSTLPGISDTSKPTHMQMADGVKKLTKINYNKRKLGDTTDKYLDVFFVFPSEFIDRVNSRKSDNDDVTTVTDFDGGLIYVLNDQAPEFWTTFDDVHIVFDAFDSEVDTTLQESKTQMLGWFDATAFELSDSYIPDLPSEAFTALLAEAKSTAALELNQSPNNKAEQISKRSRAWLSQESFKVGGGVVYKTNYGRQTRRKRQSLLDLSSTSTRSNN